MEPNIKRIDASCSVTGQIEPSDLHTLAGLGFRSVICNRPDHEGGPEQPQYSAIKETAQALGLCVAYLPVQPSGPTAQDAQALRALLAQLPAPILAYCRTGNRSSKLYELTAQAKREALAFDVVIMGGGSAGISVCASLLKRDRALRIAVIEPSAEHYYQPAWTLVGGGAYEVKDTVRPTEQVMPKDATWIKASLCAFAPERKVVLLSDATEVSYEQLIVCPGLELAWEKIEGLEETLGKHGVTSNYRYDLAPYTWQLVRSLRSGKALFTQPPMPIKCAGAPQKALYLACDHWRKQGVLEAMSVEFNVAGAALFGVATFVPPLMKYIEAYNAKLTTQSNLVKVDGPNKTAWFEVSHGDGNVTRHEKTFDMLHVVPPQQAPDVIRRSSLADSAGWFETDPATLQHPRHAEIFAVGDVCGTSNAKTAAAVRKQVVVVADNLIALRKGVALPKRYDGYGSCPLTVEKGKVILAEFGYGGKLLPTFPLDPTVARQSAWWLKASFLPWFYWQGMLKGREWFTDCAAN